MRTPPEEFTLPCDAIVEEGDRLIFYGRGSRFDIEFDQGYVRVTKVKDQGPYAPLTVFPVSGNVVKLR